MCSRKESTNGHYLKKIKKSTNIEKQQLSVLSSLPGVGEKTAVRMLEKFGTPLQVFGASVTDLSKVSGLGNERAKKIKKMLHNTTERVKQLVIESHGELNTMPKNSVFNPLKIRKSAGAVEVIDEKDIPDEYWITVQTKKLDKKRILEELKDGTKIPGVRLLRKNFVGGFR